MDFLAKTIGGAKKQYNTLKHESFFSSALNNTTRVSRRIGTVGELGPLIRRIGTTLF